MNKKLINLRSSGKYDELVLAIDSILSTKTPALDTNSNLLYLKLECLRLLNQHEQARDIIDKLKTPELSLPYLKALRKSITHASQLDWFNNKINRYIRHGGQLHNKYFNQAFLYNELGLKDLALELIKKRFFEIVKYKKPSHTNQVLSQPIKKWSNLASLALLDLHHALNSHDIEFFLISGTLLGAIRNNALLKNDYDIDIGVDVSIDFTLLIKALYSSQKFINLENNFQNLFISFKHLNGVKIDIFVHYKINNKYRHRSRYVAWDNSQFKLIEKNFLGKTFLICSNPELYLEENYGDWKVPVQNYNTYLDTPNLHILCLDDMLFQIVYNMTTAYFNNKVIYHRLLDKYQELSGETL